MNVVHDNYLIKQIEGKVLESKAAIVITWNATKWTPQGRGDLPLILALEGDVNVIPFVRSWSVGSRKSIEIGTAVFLLRLGSERGILAKGETVTEIFEDAHWSDDGATARYVLIRFENVVPIDRRLSIEVLVDNFPTFPWMNLQQSGVELHNRYFDDSEPANWQALEDLWNHHLQESDPYLPSPPTS
jgi:hypothetical protein